MKQGNRMRDVSICRSEYLLLNRVDRSNSVRSLMLRPDIMSIILFIAFEASLFLKNAFISERKFVPLDPEHRVCNCQFGHFEVTHFLPIAEISYAFFVPVTV